MSNNNVVSNLGIVTAYRSAQAGGYTGTYEEFVTLLANIESYEQSIEQEFNAILSTLETLDDKVARADAISNEIEQYVSRAETAAESSEGNATAASTSASAAQTSMQNAATSEAEAAASASEAGTIARNLAADMQGYVSDAVAAQTAAEGYADDAADSATEALGAESRIGFKETAINGLVGQAAESEVNARTYAGNAETSAQNASDFADQAEHWAEVAQEATGISDEIREALNGKTDKVDTPFAFGVDATTGAYGYKKAGADSVTPFRNPTGNAAAADVLSGKTFANASRDSVTGSMPTLTSADFAGTHSSATAGAASNYVVKSSKAGYIPNGAQVNSLAAGTSPTIATTAATGTKTIDVKPGYYNKISVNQTNAYNAGKGLNITKVGSVSDWGYISNDSDNFSGKTGTITINIKSLVPQYSSLSLSNFFFKNVTCHPRTSNKVDEKLELNSYNASTGVLTLKYTVSSSGGSHVGKGATFTADVYCAWPKG